MKVSFTFLPFSHSFLIFIILIGLFLTWTNADATAQVRLLKPMYPPHIKSLVTYKDKVKPVKISQRIHEEPLDLVLTGVNHPFFPADNYMFPYIASELIDKSKYLSDYQTFATGKELIETLKEHTRNNYLIRYLVLLGHSGYDGYFVEERSGFHRNSYKVIEKGKHLPFTKKVSNIKELANAVKEKTIVFHPDAIIILAGCNTAYGESNFALDIAKATNLPVVGSNQKVDLYHVQNLGEELKGLENKTFFVYFPEGGNFSKINLNSNTIYISEVITLINKYREEKILRMHSLKR